MKQTVWLVLVAIGVALSLSLAGASSASSRSANGWLSLLDLRRACGPERRVELTTGSVSVHIQSRWLDTMYGPTKQLDGTCPTKPVTFNGLILDTRGLGNPTGLDDLDMRFVYFRLGRIVEQDIDKIPLATEQITNFPFVRDVTIEALPALRRISNARVYDVHYAPGDPKSTSRIRFSCAGIVGQPGGRGCFTPRLYYFQGLSVAYKFRSKNPGRPGAPVKPDVWGTDPEIILAVDGRIRAWIEGLRMFR